ncbi:MAG: NfeD family protein [bacterium]|nr:NfeD family protein [bacterium]MDE0289239.1 NfeD family protein [bacterium]MDE0438099.1 NfeD family protein [bacterium]
MTGPSNELVRKCRRYWLEAGISRRAVDSMSKELESHLSEAAADGRDPRSVVGDDLPGFAADWASELLPRRRGQMPSWRAVEHRLDLTSSSRMLGWVSAAVLIALVAVIIITWRKESIMDNELWRWVWTGLALVMGLGEIVTAGFFLLPFAVGAGLAAIASWFGLHDAVQWVAFFGGTAVAMLFVRRFMRAQDEEDGLKIGPSRYVGMRAVVLERVDMPANSGLIRVEAEEWRAITDGSPIPEGTTVEVVEVRGTRLLVTEVE